MNNIFKRTINCSNQEKRVSLFKIWLNFHLTNEYFKHKDTNCFWRISSKYKLISRVSEIFYAIFMIILMLLYIKYVYYYINLSGNNLFYIAVNILTFFLPLIIIEFIIVRYIPLECKEE